MARGLSLYLADLVHPNNQLKTFPYAAGCVGAYAAEAFGSRLALDVFRSPEELGQAFASRVPDVLACTNYVWNLELAYDVVGRAKAVAPRLLAVMGGPNYPLDADEQRAFLRRYPLVDFYIYKEGEAPFLELLTRLVERDLDGAGFRRDRVVIPAVHYLVDGDLVAPAPAPRQRNLDDFPSPYLGGLLDKFFADKDLAPLIQTKRGCPFECTFCVEGEDYYTKLASVSTARFRAELEYVAQRMQGGTPVLQIADSNFGMYAHDLEICDVIADVRHAYGWPETIEVSTGKNRKERVLEAVRRTHGAMRFGPALQSVDPRTLANIKRSNISEEILMEMAAEAMKLGQRSFTELILGLPGETAASHLRSIRAGMVAGVQRIKMYPLILLPGTEIASQATRGEFGLETRFRVVPQCRGTYRFLDASFPSVEVDEVVIATSTMSLAEYLACKRFELSVEIFYNDLYLEEIHGLAPALGLSMFEFVERCHARLPAFPPELAALYDALEEDVCANMWPTRDACLEHFRDPDRLEAFIRDEYKNSIASLKAIALLQHIDAVLEIAHTALCEGIVAAGREPLADYVDELVRYSTLRRTRILDSSFEPEGTFRFAFDRIRAEGFRVDPAAYALPAPRRMRFWHDDVQARALRDLCAEVPNPVLRARSFIYPRTDPGVNPYLRQSAFC